MEKDLRELFKKEREIDHPREQGHEVRFIEKLYEELPNKEKSSPLLFKIAASIIFLVGVGFLYYNTLGSVDSSQTNFTLGQLSPDLKKIENYYSSNIEILLTHIERNKEDKHFESRYFNRLSILQQEYEALISEIKEEGPNSFIVSALVNNLQLQLELLQELNQKITSSKNENHEII